jgi:hypothetical protein
VAIAGSCGSKIEGGKRRIEEVIRIKSYVEAFEEGKREARL